MPLRLKSTLKGRVAKRRTNAKKLGPNDIDQSTAEQAVKAILEDKTCEYDLVPHAVFRKAHGKFRSDAYQPYDFLCLRNTRTCVGWLLCAHAKGNACELSVALRRFKPKIGTTALLKHSETHDCARNDERLTHLQQIQIPLSEKRMLTDKAVSALVHGLLPLSFTYNLPGMLAFAEQLVKIGQNLPPNTSVDIVDLLPCTQTVTNRLHERATEVRADAAQMLPKLMKVGGGVSCDGLKQRITGHKFYDLVLHYVETKKHPLTGQVDVVLQSRVLMLVQHHGLESAEQIHKNLDNALVERFGLQLDALLSKFTLVTDWAATLPNIVGASSSSARLPFGSRWVGCIVHKLNTTLKHVMESAKASESRTWKDLKQYKEIVRVFKSGAWNNGLPDGFALYQECETRFGTTYEVVKRFLKAAPHVTSVINAKNHVGAKNALNALEVSVDSVTSIVTYPALHAICEVFAAVRHMQNFMEGATYPAIHFVLPMWKDILGQLSQMSSANSCDPSIPVRHVHTQVLAKALLNELAKMEIHGVWAAACLLHPGMCTFEGFVRCETERAVLRLKGVHFVRSLLSPVSGSKAANNSVEARATSAPNLGESSITMRKYMAFPKSSGTQHDELSRYLSTPVDQCQMDALMAEGDHMAIFASGRVHRILIRS